MKIQGTFTTPASAAALRELFASPTALEQVPTLSDVERVSPEMLTMVFTPRLTLGPVPLATTVTTVSESADTVELTAVGSRGTQSVTVALAVTLDPTGGETSVAWTADVVVRGGVASVGQRVVGDLAGQAIGDLLAASASVAAGVPA
jgi:carbon monoxide dehydrogenase subunit G